MNTKPESGH